MDLQSIPLFDHHCHALERPGAPPDGPAFRRYFSESADPAMATHLAFSLFYQRGLRDLAALLECEPSEEEVLAVRRGAPFEEYARRLIEAANISTMLVDTGLARGESCSLDEQRRFLPCAVREVLRLESLMEQLIVETESFSQLEDAYRARLSGARQRGIAAFKSIAAYRGGLEMVPRRRAEAAAVYPELKSRARRDGGIRLSNRPLLEYLLRVGLEEAAAQELPVQIHTGFGDHDLDLRAANPLHLRPLLRDPALRGAPIVRLHTWPFTREAGYLAGLYGHVYTDLSLAIPFTAHGGAAATSAAAYDNRNLYLAWEVKDSTPWVNGATAPENLYLGGDTVDFQLGTDAGVETAALTIKHVQAAVDRHAYRGGPATKRMDDGPQRCQRAPRCLPSATSGYHGRALATLTLVQTDVLARAANAPTSADHPVAHARARPRPPSPSGRSCAPPPTASSPSAHHFVSAPSRDCDRSQTLVASRWICPRSSTRSSRSPLQGPCHDHCRRAFSRGGGIMTADVLFPAEAAS